MQNVQASLLPFHLHRKTIQVPEGLNLQEIVKHIYPRKISGIDIIVNIGDEVIPMSKWRSVKPKSHTLIGINAVAGKGGGKNPLAIILTIAVIIAAPYIAAAIAPVAAGAVAAGTATFGQIAVIGAIKLGVSLVGFLAVSMLSSVPKQNQRGSGGSPAEASSQFIEGASNKIDRYGVIPVNLGVNRMFPPQGALPYTETSAGKQYVRQIFVYGFGKVQITERKIGETAITEYDGIETNDRLNSDLSSGVALYSNDVFQDGYSVLVSNAAGYITRTTQLNTDEAEIDLTFAGGLTEYTTSAQRIIRAVEFELQFSPAGAGTWSNGNSNVTHASQTVTAASPTAWITAQNKRVGYGILVLNLNTGIVTSVSYDHGATPIVPADSIRIASFRTEGTSTSVGGPANIVGLVDERATHIPGEILNSGDFAFTYGGTGLSISVASGTVVGRSLTVQDATAQALRISQHIKFPSRGRWDIRIKRLTADSVSDQIRDAATLTAIRSIRHSSPITQTDVSGTAMRILATDQLNGSVSQYNCIVSSLIKDYNADLDVWVDDVITSNPASIYRYVLQSPAFVKRLGDARINLDKLEEWHTYCVTKGLTYNKVIDTPTSIDDLLNDIAAAGMATTHKINGIYSVLIDNERPTIMGMVTPRNSWGYNGSITYPDLPHALRVQFRNAAQGYITDERIVYADGYDETTATLFERLDFESCTNSDLAWFYGRAYQAAALLQPEVHNFNMDFENLTFNRGDKIIFVNDAILVGVGQGRILSFVYDNPMTPTQVLGFTIDDVVNIPTTDQFGVRIRHGDASGFLYHPLTTIVGDTDTFTFTTPIAYGSEPPLDSLCSFTQFGEELELIVTEIQMNKDQSARIVAVNYAPERFNATTGTIPAFNSNITLPSDFYRPLPPILNGDIQSGESVMLRNSDGSYISRMLIPIKNVNEPSVNTVISVRPVSATQWFRPNILSATPEMVIITGLEDGSRYDIRISYQRQGGLELMSQPLSLNNTLYEGASANPADVTGFRVTSSDGIGLFDWNNNTDIDLKDYQMRFSSLTTGATWITAQVVADNITSNRINLPIQSGTYLLKARDILGNLSTNEAVIISFDSGAFNNVVEVLTQQPGWAGTKTNTVVNSSDIVLISTAAVGYYYFDPSPFDLGDVYESVLSSLINAVGYNVSGLSPLIRPLDTVRDSSSIRGIDPADWNVTLEINKSLDNITYNGWETFTTGKHLFRYIKARLVLNSYNVNISPRVISAELMIDMPDRFESEEGVACSSSTGATITYSSPFKNNPAVNITLQGGATDDKIVYISKTSSGFQIKVYNATAAAYVTRTFDYHAAGYGRIIP